MNTRRQFLISAPLTFLVAATACRNETQPPANSQTAQTPPAGAPPTFGTGKGSGPAVSPETFAEAEKLVQVELTPAERQQAAVDPVLRTGNERTPADLTPPASRTSTGYGRGGSAQRAG